MARVKKRRKADSPEADIAELSDKQAGNGIMFILQAGDYAHRFFRQ
jgi:hypothetical protein